MKQVAILGTGSVGQVLAGGFARHGYGVTLGTRNPAKKIEWKDAALAGLKVTGYAEAAREGEMAVLAVKGAVAEEVVKGAAGELAGKVVLDATNPIAPSAPEKGVLKFFTSLEESLMERLQRAAPEARFVKCFSSVGAARMVNPAFGVRPSMFICGNDEAAKNEAKAILETFGWEAEDMGGAEAARAIEPLAILWCIPGFLRNEWTHAFKVLR